MYLVGYSEACEIASEEQGINEIINELKVYGIEAESHQTGGFTMCAYISLSNEKYIYANLEGCGLYGEDYLMNIKVYSEIQTGKVIASDIAQYIKEMKNHSHSFIYGDIPALGECACGSYRVFNRNTQKYEIYSIDEKLEKIEA